MIAELGAITGDDGDSGASGPNSLLLGSCILGGSGVFACSSILESGGALKGVVLAGGVALASNGCTTGAGSGGLIDCSCS